MANEIVRFYWQSQSSPLAASLVEAGTFTLTFGGQETSAIAFDATAATIQTALEALSSIGSGNVAVTIEADGFTIEFIGALANTNVGSVTTSLSSVTQKADTVTIQVTQSGVADTPTNPSNSTTTTAVSPVNEVQKIGFGGATTGTFDVSGNSTSATVSTLDTSGVQSAMDGIWGSGNTSVTWNGSDYDVTFQSAKAAMPVDTMSVSANSTDGNPYVSAAIEGVAGVSQVDQCTFSAGAAVAGTFSWESGTTGYMDTPNISGAVVTGNASTGTITTTWSDYSSHTPASVSNIDLASAVGQQHIQTITLADSPTEGAFGVRLGIGSWSSDVGYAASANDVAMAFEQADPAHGYDGSGTGPWTITSTNRIANPGTFDGADNPGGGGHLRKAVAAEIVVVQAGVTAAGGAGVSAQMLVEGWL